MAQTKNYAPNVFLKKKMNNFGDEEIEIGIKDRKVFIEWLSGLGEVGGYTNLRATPQKNDNTKLSLYENTYQKKTAEVDDLPY